MSEEDTMHHLLALAGLAVPIAVVLVFFGMLTAASAPTRHLSLRDRVQLAHLRLGADAGVVSLADAALGSLSDIQLNVINEFRKSSWLLDNMMFDDAVNPQGGGATLTYGYTRAITQKAAAFRAINAEYTPSEVTRQQYTTNLRPLGGSFQIDRVLARVGSAVANEVSIQLDANISAAKAKFNDAIINGDTAVDANGFDGLNKALTGSTTEIDAGHIGLDLTTSLTSVSTAIMALKVIDDALGVMDGPPSVVMGNSAVISWLTAAAKMTNAYTENVISFDEGGGTAGTVRQYGNLVLLDPGTISGANTAVIPTRSATVDTVAGTYSDLFFARLAMDGFHGVSLKDQPLVETWLPDYPHAGAVKTGEVELGPVAVALKATRAAAVIRNVRSA